MASIEVKCANQNCNSENVNLKESVETRWGVFEHSFECTDCKTRFYIATELLAVSEPGVTK